MKLSDRLFSETQYLWIEASSKEFLKLMACGTLDKELYSNYMLQDYLYLLDYIDILKDVQKMSSDHDMTDFLETIIKATTDETYMVHLPNMKKTGITDSDIENCRKAQIFTDYISYMQMQLHNHGILAGLTALLQCSWNYAYIGKKVSDRYKEELNKSIYKSWFDAYTSKEYIESNQLWIDIIDKSTSDISNEETDTLCNIFKECAHYENKLWDYLISYKSVTG